MEIDKKTTYQNLRSEIMDNVKRQDTYLLTSYTMCISIWTIALEMSSEWITLFPVIILIPISLRICDFRYANAFLGAYMAICLEDAADDGWEYISSLYHKRYASHSKSFSSYCSKLAFGVLTLISCVLFWAIRDFNIFVFGQLWVGLAIILSQISIVIFQCVIWWRNTDTSKIKASLMKNWRELVNSLKVQEA